MNIQELKDKRVALVVEATKLVTANMSTEDNEKFDKIYKDADALKATIDRAEKAEAMEAELRSVNPLPASPFSNSGSESEAAAAEVRAAKQKEVYKNAFDKHIRGFDMSAEERKALSGGQVRTQSGATGSAGGFLVPTTLLDQIEVGLKWFGGMRKVASSIKTSSGNPLDWPTNNDTANPGKRLNATTVPGTVDELDTTFGQVVFGAWTYTTQQITVQNELLQDSAFDLESFIKDAFVTRIGRIQNTEFTVGTGTTMPNGIVTQATLGKQGVVGQTLTVTYNDLVDLIHSVDIAYRPNAQFMFHDTFLAALRKLVDTQNRPLLGLGINGGDPDQILGYKYTVNNDVAPMGVSAKSCLFGDLSKYKIRDVANYTNILKLVEIGAQKNQTVFVGFTRADGQLVDPGTAPVKYYANSAT